MGLKAQRLQPATGVQTLIGKTGEANTILDPLGIIKINGEIWNAESLSGKINTGEKIIVKEIKKLTLYVEQVKDSYNKI
jgi:membrane-bound serine protease (ClpP class)